jgi:Tfp pilus assembly protein PilE
MLCSFKRLICGNSRGATLVLVIVIAAIVAIASALTYKMIIATTKRSGSYRIDAALCNIAEAGKEHALARLRTGQSSPPQANSTSTILNPTSFGGGSYTVACHANSDASKIWITSTATMSNRSKSVESEVNITPCQIVMYQGTPHSPTVPFAINGGVITPSEEFNTSMNCIGAAFTISGYQVAITARLKVGTTAVEPWGTYNDPSHANLIGQNTAYSFPDVYDPNTPVSVEGWAWYRSSSHSSWTQYNHVNSDPSNDRVKVLRDGDPVPNTPGFAGQLSAKQYLEDYISDDGTTMKLSPTQAIFLFEFTTASLTSSSADFQDMVILASFTPPGSSGNNGNGNGNSTPSTGTCPCDCFDAGAVGGSININPNNSDNEFELTKPDGTKITRDDLKNGTVTSYNGPATLVHVKPKGNGNQNAFTANGSPYALDNSTTYDIASETMTVNLHQDGNGQGQWDLDINATGAHVGNAGTDAGCSCECNGAPSGSQNNCTAPTYMQVGWKEF